MLTMGRDLRIDCVMRRMFSKEYFRHQYVDSDISASVSVELRT